MMLSINTYKVRKIDNYPIHNTYRYACFDTDLEFKQLSFEEKFNTAMNILKEKINQDRNNNDITKYEAIVISDVFLS